MPPKSQSRGPGLCSPLRIAGSIGVACLVVMALLVVEMAKQDNKKKTRVLIQSDITGIRNRPLPSPSPPPARPKVNIIEVAKRLDPEIMEHAPKPEQYDKGYKNPCWKVDGKLKCLPYFYMAGAFQAGINTLYSKLTEHPDVINTEVSRWQFWGEDGKTMSEYVTKNGEGAARELDAAPQRRIIVDASSSTMAFYWSAALRTHRAFQSVIVSCHANCTATSKGKTDVRLRCMDEQCYPAAMAKDLKVAEDLGVDYDELQVPLLVAAAHGEGHLPKLILMLRNPIDRLHCAYWQYSHYHKKYGETAQGFADYVEEQVSALEKCASKGHGMRKCALLFEALGSEEEQIFFHADQFIRGMYSLYLEVWLRHFPRDQLLIIKSEDYFKDSNAVLKQVYTFLGLEEPTDDKVLRSIAKAGRPTSFTSDRPAMLPAARQRLQGLYKSWNEELATLLQDEAYRAWK
mmetsp:Transcript_36158/g.80462  ORF Transcript_36158/g.80462 Transcript_36158/m.80462 type:complete len:459 (-) Transcript_36158:759-2135(-)|eukprot:CAMPEP_0202906240 /NCGR_PEP_ID=MMETSP1392-20130828/37900_1 /ASSEMBLY_ACC=CAM_ASM_000868 /TAXON_ID=225041 /ORGANISM="Chlamydomonas chlamydogama, Strain SAG 11-48b" /LENGTH=458 /DNA_ID=CAMNT_0049594641 /DNA_START=83 /DNA_END=1459 /DNA_ORIENTATION=-